MSGFNWTDFAVIAIIGFSMFMGWKKGFIIAAMEFVKWIAAIVIARLFHVQFTNFIRENLWDPTESRSEHVQTFLYDMLGYDPMTGESLSQLQMSQALESMNLPENLDRVIQSALSEKVIETSVGFVEEVTYHITNMMVNGLGFLFLVVLLLMGFGVVQFIGNLIAKLPLLKEINQGAGLILGGIIGLVTVYFIMAVISYIPTFEWSRTTIETVQKSQFAIYFYKYNVLQYVFNTVIIEGNINL